MMSVKKLLTLYNASGFGLTQVCCRRVVDTVKMSMIDVTPTCANCFSVRLRKDWDLLVLSALTYRRLANGAYRFNYVEILAAWCRAT